MMRIIKNLNAAGIFFVVIWLFFIFSISDFFILEDTISKFLATVLCMVFLFLLYRGSQLIRPLGTMIVSFCLAELLVTNKMIDAIVELKMPFDTKDLMLVLAKGIWPILASGLPILFIIFILQKNSTKVLKIPSLFVFRFLTSILIILMIVIFLGMHAKLSGINSLKSKTLEEQAKELGLPTFDVPQRIEKLAKISSLCAECVFDGNALEDTLGTYLNDEDEAIRLAAKTAIEERDNISDDIDAFREEISKSHSRVVIPSVTVPVAITFFVTMKSALDEKLVDQSPTKDLSTSDILMIIDPRFANMSLLKSNWDEKNPIPIVRSPGEIGKEIRK